MNCFYYLLVITFGVVDGWCDVKWLLQNPQYETLKGD